jgi:hypothetical protein
VTPTFPSSTVMFGKSKRSLSGTPLNALPIKFNLVQILIELRNRNPDNQVVRKDLAGALLDHRPPVSAIGTVDRGRHLLQLIYQSFPTPALQSAYFENLEHLLRMVPRSQKRGQIVLGFGSGRSGSTSLTALLSTIEQSCCTHENPPLLYWERQPEQIEFHARRFEILARHFSLVFDASHWWLPAYASMATRFPDLKAIGLVRNERNCVESFFKVKGSSRGSLNHWVPAGNGIWRANFWDPTYPTYSIPTDAARNPDAAKRQLIARYVSEYNHELARLAASDSKRVLLIKLEDFDGLETKRRIFEFIGFSGTNVSPRLNVGTVADSISLRGALW